MSKATYADPQILSKEDAFYKMECEKIILEIKSMNEFMDSNRVTIDRLNKEIGNLRDETRAMLKAMGAKV